MRGLEALPVASHGAAAADPDELLALGVADLLVPDFRLAAPVMRHPRRPRKLPFLRLA